MSFATAVERSLAKYIMIRVDQTLEKNLTLYLYKNNNRYNIIGVRVKSSRWTWLARVEFSEQCIDVVNLTTYYEPPIWETT